MGATGDDVQGEHISPATACGPFPLHSPAAAVTAPLRMLERTFMSSPFTIHL